MNRVQLLPESVANQIAAGEVVERPASVVKELVENAVDARSTRVVVEIQRGGRSLIRITDDGEGMNRDDALLCLERHATSKLRRAEDLFAIQTLGFRGEALPSISSVSRFGLTTRERGNASGEATRVVVQGGRIVEVKAAGHPPGTTIEVRQLFYNVPARRKFLRSAETERAHIQHYLTLAALAYPEVGFTFTQDQRLVWQLPPIASGQEGGSGPASLEALKERLRCLYGSGLALVRVEFGREWPAEEGEEEAEGEGPIRPRPFRVWGYIGAPGVSRATRQDQHLFVNRRPVENRGLNYALLEGYHNALMKGRYPVCCLFVEIDPAQVDVNIHPSKREVKFRQESLVRHWVSEAIREALLEFHRGAAPAADAGPRPGVRQAPGEIRGRAPQKAGSPVKTEGPERDLLAPKPEPARTREAENRDASDTTDKPDTSDKPEPLQAPNRTPAPLLRVPLRLVGVVGELYVVLESDRGLVLMDQHAAHERVLYEQMLERMERGGASSQRLLLPETLELSARDTQFLREHLDVLNRLGVELSPFGQQTFLLEAVPPFIRGKEARRFVLELVDELKATGSAVNSLRLGEEMIAKTVCRHAVKANDPLTLPELERLLEDLRRCAMPYTCPHGRPTLIEMNYRELERKFGRVV